MSDPGNFGPMPVPQNTLYGRRWSVVVANDSSALDLSELHITFSIEQQDVETPNNATIRIYNLSDATTVRLLSKEYSRVVVSAGYKNGPYGVIFDGTIKQSKRGRLDQTLTYLDILAADGDEAYNFGVISQSLAAGATVKDQIDAVASGLGVDIGSLPEFANLGDPEIIRGKVLFGLAKDRARQIALSNNARWSLQNNKFVMIANDAYITADPIVLTSNTGLIGLPEQTQDGIKVTTLLNPKLIIGKPVKIDNKSIQAALFDVAYGALNFFPTISYDGLYRIVISEFAGDTRGNDWYSYLTCFSIDPAVPAAQSVNPWPT